MMHHILWLHKLSATRFFTSCVLTITLSSTQAALAGYQPPRDQKAPTTYTDSSGVRGGCKAISARELTILAPVNHVGRTSSPYPTFAWFIPNSQPMPMEFTLYEFDANSQPKVVKKLSLHTSPGIMKLRRSSQLPSLTVGKRYLWQVEILCNRNRPSRNVVARAEIEVVQMPHTLKTALSDSRKSPRSLLPQFPQPDRFDKALLYAKAGMWYDALGEALQPTADEQLATLTATLLQDLAKLEKPQQSKNLTKIAKIALNKAQGN